MDYKIQLERFVDLSRQMANRVVRTNRGDLCRSFAAWQAFINGLEYYEKIFQEGVVSPSASDNTASQKSIYKLTEEELLSITAGLECHPQGWEYPCDCKDCRGYGD